MSQFARQANRRKRYRKGKGPKLSGRQKQEIQKMISEPVEKKYFDTAYPPAAVSASPTFYDITDMAQGVDSNEMIGTSINLLSIQYRFVFSLADTTNYIRFIIFQWYGDMSVDVPSWSKIFQYHVAGVPVSLYDYMSPYILSDGNKNRMFKILMDQRFYLDSDNPIQLFDGFINKGFRKNVGNVDLGGGSFGGVNKIYLMTVSDSGTVSHPALDGFTRIRFTDS